MAGVIIGRFMPPHIGHLYLIDFARAMTDRLYVLVCTLSHEPIPGNLRYEWVRTLAPSCEVIHITEEIPEAKRGTAGATTIWADSVRAAVPEPVTQVFASEEYGWELAWRLDAQFIPVDPSRDNIPVSASAIRANPFENWRFIPPVVRPWFVKHVAVVGKPFLAEVLAQDLETVVVHPYRDFWQLTWNEFAGRRDANPLSEEQIIQGSSATVTALARHANRFLIHDIRHPQGLREAVSVPGAVPDLIIADPEDYDPQENPVFDAANHPLTLAPDQAGAKEIETFLLDQPAREAGR